MSNERSCFVCDKIYILSPRGHLQKYCSKRCCTKAAYRMKNNLPLKIKEIKCEVCDKSFMPKSLNNTCYCSEECSCIGGGRKYQGSLVKRPRVLKRHSGHTNRNGYRLLAIKHPNSSKHGKILEHVFIMSNHLKRPLDGKETVHHKNGIRNDNRIENLELWSHSHPFGQRVEDKIAWCKEFLGLYGYDVILR